MRDDELSPALRRAYEREPETAEPSDLLWKRTRRALRERGALAGRRSSWRRWSAAALLAAASFVGGLVLGAGLNGDETGPPPPSMTDGALVPTLAAERVQEAGTSYAVAVERLARSLEGATVDDIATGQQVVLSASEAHEASAGLLLAGGAVDVEPGAGTASGDQPLIWF